MPGAYDPHVFSPSLCHLADPDILLQVMALPLLTSSALPFQLTLAFPILGAWSPMYAIFSLSMCPRLS